MRTLLLAGVLAVAGFAIATPISIAPASAQVGVDTPLGGVRVGPQPRYHREDYDRPAYRAYGYDTESRKQRASRFMGTTALGWLGHWGLVTDTTTGLARQKGVASQRPLRRSKICIRNEKPAPAEGSLELSTGLVDSGESRCLGTSAARDQHPADPHGRGEGAAGGPPSNIERQIAEARRGGRQQAKADLSRQLGHPPGKTSPPVPALRASADPIPKKQRSKISLGCPSIPIPNSVLL